MFRRPVPTALKCFTIVLVLQFYYFAAVVYIVRHRPVAGYGDTVLLISRAYKIRDGSKWLAAIPQKLTFWALVKLRALLGGFVCVIVIFNTIKETHFHDVQHWLRWLRWLPHSVNCVRFCFGDVCDFIFCSVRNISGTAERICAKFTGKMCLVPRSDKFEGQDQRPRSPRTKTAFFGPFGGLRAVYVW